MEPFPGLEFRVYAVRRGREFVRKWYRMKAELQAEGAWIFVCHSHRDLETVRRIRNELERPGHNPLLSFLKCLEADDARLPELIRDEIKARAFCVLCNTSA